jgi:hypothetical protein
MGLASVWAISSRLVLSVVSLCLGWIVVGFATLKWRERYIQGLPTILLFVACVAASFVAAVLWPAGVVKDGVVAMFVVPVIVLGLWQSVTVKLQNP